MTTERPLRRPKREEALRWVIFTVALERDDASAAAEKAQVTKTPMLPEAKLAADEMDGYNWLARRLSRASGPGREVGVLSFKSVPLPKEMHEVTPNTTAGQILCYLIRVRDGTEPGAAAPDWIQNALIKEKPRQARREDDAVRFRAISLAVETRLGGRS